MKTYFNLEKVKKVSLFLSQLNEKKKNTFLQRLATTLQNHKNIILETNKKDIKNAKTNKLSSAFIQRLTLNENGFTNMISRLIDLQKLKSGIGTVISKKQLRNGILLKKVAVPIGTILVIYESRPEVTVDIAALCIKSGNVALLKGGSEAINTNRVLYICIKNALVQSCIEKNAVSFVEDRKSVNFLLKQNEYIDLVIARGSYSLVKTILKQSSIPVLAHAAGGARIYVDKSADLSHAIHILINAKISKPAACNSLDTILIHRDIKDSFILELVQRMQSLKVSVMGDTYISKLTGVKKVNNSDWDTEFLGLKVSIKMVENSKEAIQFINTYTKKHSEGIIAADKKAINTFTKEVDAAALFINCSTRFNDGYEFGLGAEMGIATGKIHARGPVGLKELTIYKWEAYGNGQIRE